MAAKREFTFHEVVTIRERAAKGDHAADIASDFGVTVESISRLARGKTYPELPGPRTTPRMGRPTKHELDAAREKTKALFELRDAVRATPGEG